MKGPVLFWTVFVTGVLADQGVKAWVRDAIPQQGSLGGKPWPGIFEITLTYNEGIAFGMFQGAGVFMSPVALIIAGMAAVHSHRHASEPKLLHWTMGLFAAGAIGNLIDRLAFGKVTDMFWFRLINFPVFNVADSLITVGTFLLILTAFLSPTDAKNPVPAEPGREQDSNETTTSA